jgi:hypothetical protein
VSARYRRTPSVGWPDVWTCLRCRRSFRDEETGEVHERLAEAEGVTCRALMHEELAAVLDHDDEWCAWVPLGIGTGRCVVSAPRPVVNVGPYTVATDGAGYDEAWTLAQVRANRRAHASEDGYQEIVEGIGRHLASEIRKLPCDPQAMGRGLLCALANGAALLPMGIDHVTMLNVLAGAAEHLIEGDS